MEKTPSAFSKTMNVFNLGLIRLYNLSIIYTQKKRNEKKLKEIQKKYQKNEKIKIIYFVEDSSIWKLDGVYSQFDKHPNFEQLILITPTIVFGEEYRVRELDKTYDYFVRRGYKVLKSYDKLSDSYINIAEDLDPDLIFHARPYKTGMDQRFYIDKFLDRLNLFVNYGYDIDNSSRQIYRSLTTNAAWAVFLESEIQHDIYTHQSFIKGKNAVISGYPGVDDIEYKVRLNNASWKIDDPVFKRIIWAPHHTINAEDFLGYSNFLEYADFMLEVADQYKEQIQFSFKPHPSLKQKLYAREDWGVEKTDDYFKKWETLRNTQVDTGPYIDLFNSSDALIHDSSSFTAEYLHTGKPVMFLKKDSVDEKLNVFGKKVLEQHYIAHNKQQIIEFIENVILKGKDVMADQRERFYKEILNPTSDNASTNIYKYIVNKVEDN